MYDELLKELVDAYKTVSFEEHIHGTCNLELLESIVAKHSPSTLVENKKYSDVDTVKESFKSL